MEIVTALFGIIPWLYTLLFFVIALGLPTYLDEKLSFQIILVEGKEGLRLTFLMLWLVRLLSWAWGPILIYLALTGSVDNFARNYIWYYDK